MKYLAQLSIPTTPSLSRIYDNFETANLGFWVSRALQYSIVIAGLIFFIKLLSAGFSYLTSAGDSGKIQAATKEITNALIGLILVISVFFIKQVLGVLFDI